MRRLVGVLIAVLLIGVLVSAVAVHAQWRWGSRLMATGSGSTCSCTP